MAKIFLSYSRNDLARIEPLAKALEKSGHEVWWDRRLTGGSEFDEIIEKALADSEVVIVAWSEAASRSAWVRDEAGVGRDRHCLVPLTVDGSLPPLGFRQFHTIDVSRWHSHRKSAEFAAIEQAVAAAAQGKELPEAPTSRPRRPGIPKPLLGVMIATIVLVAVGGAWLWVHPAQARPYTVGFAGLRAIGRGVDPALAQSLNEEVRTAFTHEDIQLQDKAADLMIRGSLERQPNGARITTSIDDPASSTTLWTQSHDFSNKDPGEIHAFAILISQTLGCVLDHTARQRPSDNTLLSLFIQACYVEQSDGGGSSSLIDLGHKMLARSRNFGGGWWALADGSLSATLMPVSGGGDSDAIDDNLRRDGEAAARQLIRLDPGNPEAYHLLAQLLPAGAAVEKEKLLRQAVAVRSEKCACGYQYLGDFLVQTGRFHEALPFYRHGLDQVPNSPLALWRAAMAQYLAGRRNAAEERLRDLEKLVEGATVAERKRPLLAMWDGRWKAAVGQLKFENPADQKAVDAALEALASGNPARIGAAGERAEQVPVTLENEYILVPVLAALGRNDAVFAALDASLRREGFYSAPGRLPGMSNPLLFDPRFQSVWNDPRFAAYLQKAGFITYWKATKSMPDACKAPAAPKFCAALG